MEISMNASDTMQDHRGAQVDMSSDPHAQHSQEAHGGHAGHAGHGDHAGHGGHAGHAGHGDHAAMFRQRFWWALLLAVPVVLYDHHLQAWLGYTMPSFRGSDWVSPALG